MAENAQGVTQQPEAQEAPAYVLPGLDKGPASFFDKDSNSYWLGIPLANVDILDALAVVDSTKLDMLQKWKVIQIERARSQKIVKPWHERAKENGAALLKKLKI